MPTYEPVNNGEIAELLATVLKEKHGRLHGVGVTFDILLALPSENDDADLVKLHGTPCYAVISVTPFKLRCRGLADVTLVIDSPKFDDLSKRQQVALLDHELTHVELATFKKGLRRGELKYDDHGRPKLKMRPHDWEIGGFDVIVERYGVDALEFVAAKAVACSSSVRQTLMPFMLEERDEPQYGIVPTSMLVPASADDDDRDGEAGFRREVLNTLIDAGVPVAHARTGEVLTNAPGVTKRRAPKKRRAAHASHGSD